MHVIIIKHLKRDWSRCRVSVVDGQSIPYRRVSSVVLYVEVGAGVVDKEVEYGVVVAVD